MIDISILQMQKLRLTLSKKWSEEDVSPTNALFPVDSQEEKEKMNWDAIPSPWNCQRPRGSPWTSNLPHPQHSLPWPTGRPLVAIQATYSHTEVLWVAEATLDTTQIYTPPTHAHLTVSQPSFCASCLTNKVDCIKKEILLAPRLEVEESP